MNVHRDLKKRATFIFWTAPWNFNNFNNF